MNLIDADKLLTWCKERQDEMVRIVRSNVTALAKTEAGRTAFEMDCVLRAIESGAFAPDEPKQDSHGLKYGPCSYCGAPAPWVGYQDAPFHCGRDHDKKETPP